MKNKKKAWILTADMGYGHQRAVYPLKEIAYERIININSDKSQTAKERKTWTHARIFYDFVSRLSEVPVIGKLGLLWIDKMQAISPYYPLKKNSAPNLPTNYLNKKIRKGFLKGVISYIQKEKLPVITSFYASAMALNHHEIENSYCIICDVDINRVWVPKDTKNIHIEYFVPTMHTYKRLKMYGVPSHNLHLTGFPLPKENIGGTKSTITKKVLAKRLINLDPTRKFIDMNKEMLEKETGQSFSEKKKPENITITYAIGGAAAQLKYGMHLLEGLKSKILLNQINLCLVAATHMDVKQKFEEKIKELGLAKNMGKNLTIIFELTKVEYFKKFNQQLNKTDILWTKPSELTFYTALGLPMILCPPVGAHEVFNKNWLHFIGSGVDQLDPKYVEQWLDEGLASGIYARKAWNGYINAPRNGTYEIEKIINKTK